MDNFKAVYKILTQLEKDMDREYARILTSSALKPCACLNRDGCGTWR